LPLHSEVEKYLKFLLLVTVESRELRVWRGCFRVLWRQPGSWEGKLTVVFPSKKTDALGGFETCNPIAKHLW